MTDLEFLSFFKINELPECSAGLWLLKQWMEDDPEVIHQLRAPERIQPVELRRGNNPIYRKFLEHTRTCPECNQLLPSLYDQLPVQRAPLPFPTRHGKS